MSALHHVVALFMKRVETICRLIWVKYLWYRVEAKIRSLLSNAPVTLPPGHTPSPSSLAVGPSIICTRGDREEALVDDTPITPLLPTSSQPLPVVRGGCILMDIDVRSHTSSIINSQ